MNFNTGKPNTKTGAEILADIMSVKKQIESFATRADRPSAGRRPMDILDRFGGFRGDPFGGMRVHVNPDMDDQPRMTASQKFADLMPAEFVADLNAWMLEFFGRENRVYCLHGHTLILGPKTLAAMERAL
jgi:hypothetical protein